MKVMVYVLLLLFLSGSQITYSQQRDSISTEIISFFQTVDSTIQHFDKLKKIFTKQYNDKQIEYLMLKYNKIINNHSKEFMAKLYKDGKDYEFRVKQLKQPTDDLRPGYKIGLIESLISKQYGQAFVNVIKVPYCLRVLVQNVTTTKYISTDPVGAEFTQVNLHCKIEEILKGEKFKKSNDITISYLSFWANSLDKNFEVGKSYFVPFVDWKCSENGCTEYAVWNFGPDFSFFPIEDGIVYLSGNPFEIGEKIEWSNFKDYFKTKFIVN